MYWRRPVITGLIIRHSVAVIGKLVMKCNSEVNYKARCGSDILCKNVHLHGEDNSLKITTNYNNSNINIDFFKYLWFNLALIYNFRQFYVISVDGTCVCFNTDFYMLTTIIQGVPIKVLTRNLIIKNIVYKFCFKNTL